MSPSDQADQRDVPATSTVLLIDDNAVQAGVRQAILRRAGYQVVSTLSPERALDQLRVQSLPSAIGLIITDHMMPGMDGAMFVRHLRSLHPDLPVLVITGLEEAEKEYEGLRVTFRTKPLLPEVLLRTVQQLMEREQAS